MANRYQYDSDDDFQPRMSQPIAVAAPANKRKVAMQADVPPPLNLNGTAIVGSLV
jgi:hypothetical protein